MKRNVLMIGVVLLLLASACAPQATPTVNPADVQQTAQAAAFTMVAETQQAMPTATSAPPTVTPTSPPTNTPPPLPTLNVQGTPGTQVAPGAETTQTTPVTGALLPTNVPTFTSQPPQSSSGSASTQNCNQPLTTWQGPTANFSIANQTRPQGTIILSMYVETEFNQCGYLIITGDSFSGPVGQYSAGAFITGKQNLKAFGGFRITEGNWKVVVRNDSILAQGGCSPNC
jgi:hypothetical protein